ncbi:NAD-dependent epimerase/dehydratase [Desulfarculus baarsii DSM 2075]|uniref:NAD-dependent epimerase/dehydratase n=2 Tax=Desulfarculus baarsii TaxID=453230 RepID=E1QFM8_DESB2|nr:NAD-dependent epimerase/dehydratase [Desulfarculus baarsii DSM 2075]
MNSHGRISMANEFSSDLNNFRHVVVGAGGFLGTNISAGFKKSNLDLLCIDACERPKYSNHAGEKNWLSGTLSDKEFFVEHLKPNDIVYHLVSTTNPSNSDLAPDKDVEDNLIGSLKLFQACSERRIKKLIFISSGGTIYGPDAPVPTPEFADTSPICSYGATKLAIEKYLEIFRKQHGLDYIIFRVSNAYGPFQIARGQGIIAMALHRFFHDEPLEIWGDGSAVRDYIFVDDIVSAVLMGAASSTQSPRLYNLGSGVGHSVNEVVEALNFALGGRLETVRREGRSVDVPRSILDIERIKLHLNWRPKIDLKAGISATVNWYREFIRCSGQDHNHEYSRADEKIN